MVQPINYMAQMPQIDLAERFGSGFRLGAGIREVRQQQQDRENQQQLLQRYQSDIEQYFQDPTPRKAQELMIRYPGQATAFSEMTKGVKKEQLDSEIKSATEVYAALNANRPEVAMSILDQQITAIENAGGDPSSLIRYRDLVEQDPTAAKGYGGVVLSGLLGPDKFGSTFQNISQVEAEQQKLPVELRKTEAEIGKIGADIEFQREENKIKLLNSQLQRETNDLRKQEIQQNIDKTKAELESKKENKFIEGEKNLSAMQESRSLLGTILGDEDTLRAAVGTSAWRGAIPGTKARTMAGLIEQLQNSIAAVNLDSLKGAMSDKDILFLKNIGSNLDRYQDEDLFIKELTRIGAKFERAQDQIVRNYGLGQRPIVQNHPTYGMVTRDQASEIAKQNGVTVDEVIQFLQETQ